MTNAKTLLFALVALSLSLIAVTQAAQPTISQNAAVRRHAAVINARSARRSVAVGDGKMVHQKRQTAEQVAQAAALKKWDDDFHSKNAEWQQAANAALAQGKTPPTYDQYWDGKSGGSSSSSDSGSSSNSGSDSGPTLALTLALRISPRRLLLSKTSSRPPSKTSPRATLRPRLRRTMLVPSRMTAPSKNPTTTRRRQLRRRALLKPVLPRKHPLLLLREARTTLRTATRTPARHRHRSRLRATLVDRRPTTLLDWAPVGGPTAIRTTLSPFLRRCLTRLAVATPTRTRRVDTRSQLRTEARPSLFRWLIDVLAVPGAIWISLPPDSRSWPTCRKGVLMA